MNRGGPNVADPWRCVALAVIAQAMRDAEWSWFNPENAAFRFWCTAADVVIEDCAAVKHQSGRASTDYIDRRQGII